MQTNKVLSLRVFSKGLTHVEDRVTPPRDTRDRTQPTTILQYIFTRVKNFNSKTFLVTSKQKMHHLDEVHVRHFENHDHKQ